MPENLPESVVRLFAELGRENVRVGTSTGTQQDGTVNVRTEQGDSINAIAASYCPSGPTVAYKSSEGKWYAFSLIAQETEKETTVLKRRRRGKREKQNNLKILFSVLNGNIREFYIGGDRVNPTKIYEFDETSEDLQEAYISNTGSGRNDYIVDIETLNQGVTKLVAIIRGVTHINTIDSEFFSTSSSQDYYYYGNPFASSGYIERTVMSLEFYHGHGFWSSDIHTGLRIDSFPLYNGSLDPPFSLNLSLSQTNQIFTASLYSSGSVSTYSSTAIGLNSGTYNNFTVHKGSMAFTSSSFFGNHSLFSETSAASSDVLSETTSEIEESVQHSFRTEVLPNESRLNTYSVTFDLIDDRGSGVETVDVSIDMLHCCQVNKSYSKAIALKNKAAFLSTLTFGGDPVTSNLVITGNNPYHYSYISQNSANYVDYGFIDKSNFTYYDLYLDRQVTSEELYPSDELHFVLVGSGGVTKKIQNPELFMTDTSFQERRDLQGSGVEVPIYNSRSRFHYRRTSNFIGSNIYRIPVDCYLGTQNRIIYDNIGEVFYTALQSYEDRFLIFLENSGIKTQDKEFPVEVFHLNDAGAEVLVSQKPDTAVLVKSLKIQLDSHLYDYHAMSYHP